MSWSRGATGTPSDVKAAAAKWAQEQRRTDEGYASSKPAEVEGHQKQIERATSAINAMCEGLADNAVVTVTANGHHNGNARSDSGAIQISYNIPTPVV